LLKDKGAKSKTNTNILINGIEHAEDSLHETTPSTGDIYLSEYEQQRIINIQRNETFLASLGLNSPSPIQKVSVSNKKKKKIAEESIISRKSSRLEKVNVKESYSENFEDCNDTQNLRDTNVDNKFHITSIDFLAPSERSETLLSDEFLKSNLQSIYSLSFHHQVKSLLIAAGKGGEVSVVKFDNSSNNVNSSTSIDNDNIDEKETSNLMECNNNKVLLSFRAHNRWISSAKFVNPQCINNDSNGNYFESEGPLALTASDDSTVKLWDLSKVSSRDSKTPLLLAESNHTLHEKGIFSMDYHYASGRILTGSKDRTVCISRLVVASQIHSLNPSRSATHFEVERRFEFHSKVVKAVAWQQEGLGGGSIFASGGQDRCVFIKVYIFSFVWTIYNRFVPPGYPILFFRCGYFTL